MRDFPDFMKNPTNRIASGSQATPGVEGYVFDGADGSQMAFWTCHETAVAAAHVHEFDEYMIVVEGCYTLVIDGRKSELRAGEEFCIPRGVSHAEKLLRGHEPFMHLAADGRSEFRQLRLPRINTDSHRCFEADRTSLHQHAQGQ